MGIFNNNIELDIDDLKDINFVFNNDEENNFLLSIKNESPINLKFNEKIGLTINTSYQKYEFILYLNKNSDNLLVLGPGFLSPEKHEKLYNKPVFDRHSWVSEFNENVLIYNDPTRYDFKNLHGGWGIGTEDTWHIFIISQIIKDISNKLFDYKSQQMVSYSNIFLYGSSMGGFISLMLSVLIENSTSLADIPQFDVTKWWYWPTLKKACLKNISDEDILRYYSNRLIFLNLIEKQKYIPNAYIVLDCSVQEDWTSQFSDFLNNLNQLPYEFNNNKNKIHLRFDGRNNGHTVLNKDQTIDFIKDVILIENNHNQKKSIQEFKKQSLSIFKKQLTKIQRDFTSNHIDNNTIIESTLDYIDLHRKFRIDIKNENSENNSISILYCSDEESIITNPNWFKDKKGIGSQIVTTKEEIILKFKCLNDGILNIKLRSVDSRDFDGKRKPINILLKNFEINDMSILNYDYLFTHDKPYIFTKYCKNNEKITLKIKFKNIIHEFSDLNTLEHFLKKNSDNQDISQQYIEKFIS